MLDIGTYGGTPAAIKLVEIINEKNIPFDRLGKLLSKFNVVLRDISKIDTITKFQVARLIYESYIKYADEYPAEVKTYVKNLLTTKYKIWLKEHKSGIPQS